MQSRTICLGDNLYFLSRTRSNSIDGVATDPPFNKNQTFDHEFSDKWFWTEKLRSEFEMIKNFQPRLIKQIERYGDRDPGREAYLTFMSACGLHIHRVLKPNGALFLFCDDDEMHSLRTVFDHIFGEKNWRNTIPYRRAHGEQGKISKNAFARNHGYILFYAKSDEFEFGSEAKIRPLTEEQIRKKFKYEDEHGRFYADPVAGGTKGKKAYDFHGLYRSNWMTEKHILEDLLKSGQLVYKPGRNSNLTGSELTLSGSNEIRFLVENEGLTTIYKKRYLEKSDHGSGDRLDSMWHHLKEERLAKNENGGNDSGKTEEQMEHVLKPFLGRDKTPLILDPFFGYGTTAVVAERFGFHWVGMESLEKRAHVAELRLKGILKHEDEIESRMNSIKKIADAELDRGQLTYLDVQKELERQLSLDQEEWKPDIEINLITEMEDERNSIDQSLGSYEDNSIDLQKDQKDTDRSFSPEIKRKCWKAQGYLCAACKHGLMPHQYEGDHTIPHSHEGKTVEENCTILCKGCNARKSTRSWDSFINDLPHHGIYVHPDPDSETKRIKSLLRQIDKKNLPLIGLIESQREGEIQ